ncbi:MAG: hypothetical protein CSA62_10780 [Planctomycetota bacterium]|nr:MAG: hypothetical protein CSA62_10780 [Planctomycetota bacterium]
MFSNDTARPCLLLGRDLVRYSLRVDPVPLCCSSFSKLVRLRLGRSHGLLPFTLRDGVDAQSIGLAPNRAA